MNVQNHSKNILMDTENYWGISFPIQLQIKLLNIKAILTKFFGSRDTTLCFQILQVVSAKRAPGAFQASIPHWAAGHETPQPYQGHPVRACPELLDAHGLSHTGNDANHNPSASIQMKYKQWNQRFNMSGQHCYPVTWQYQPFLRHEIPDWPWREGAEDLYTGSNPEQLTMAGFYFDSWKIQQISHIW